MQLLKGKKTIVTGGSSGIGKEIACHFFSHGADVIIFGTDENRAKEAVEKIKQYRTFSDQIVEYRLVDVSNLESVNEILSTLLKRWDKVDILVNNAGITRDNLFIKMPEKDWDDVVNINLKSLFNTCQSLVRPMMKARYGKIINITSVVGLTGNAGQANYAASKSGMIGFTKSLAKELASRGICVNCIAPGYIKTRMTDSLPDQAKESILSTIPMKRIGCPRDIANVAVFLASDLSDYITGQIITVDGGMVM